MARKQKVITDFTKVPDNELDQKAGHIIESLSNPPGSTNFPTPQPALTVVQDDVDAYVAALNNLGNGIGSTAAKDAARKTLEETLSSLGDYLNLSAKGDAVKLSTTGFDLTSVSNAPIGDLPKPSNFSVKADGKGEIAAKCKSIKGAKIYQWEYKKVGDENWIVKQTTKSKILLTGLESGKEYIFRIVAIGTSSGREYSDEIKSFVL